MGLVVDGELALSDGVPHLDGVVSASGGDLSVVGGEGNGGAILLVAIIARELADALSALHLPESEGLVPGSGQGVGAIVGDLAVGDNIRVSLEALLDESKSVSLASSP